MDGDDFEQVPPEQPGRELGRGDTAFLVVGLGASAGGVEALQAFFAHVPADSGIAYVVILHLSPDHDSQLAAILQAVTPIPVTQVKERVLVEPNHVYVIPPNRHLLMLDGSLAVSPTLTVEERRAPVDLFFRTLAESHGARAVGVVLSGTGANGSMGLKRIKERGGVVFVQDPHQAAYGEMPRNAIATNLVDAVLPVAAILDRIVAYRARLGLVTIPLQAEERSEDQQQALREVLLQLRVRTGHDFSNYKRPTLFRRIERRITVRNLPDLPSYAAFLKEHPDEAQALLKDLLISVTNFFRDKEAFAALEQEIVPRILAGKTAQDEVRVWVAGCATGEEAYSLAMLLAERGLDTLDAPKVQLFATDIDEAALAHARQGLYTLSDAADVSPERLHRFFSAEGNGYRIRPEIREMVLFANHNLLKDPPFAHLNLVSCRNVLIYLNRAAQERVIETLHFALDPGGYLMLGTSEMVDGASDLFAPVSREHHLFQSRPSRTRSFPIPESVPLRRLELSRVAERPREQEPSVREQPRFGDLHLRLLEQYAPPSVIVNQHYEIVHLSGRAGRYLQFADGLPSNNLLRLIRPELGSHLRNALYQAQQRQTNVAARNVSVRIDDSVETINILVRPVLREDDPAQGFVLVVFEPSAETASDAELVVRSESSIVQQLEAEVVRLQVQLRASNEQHTTHAEELKAVNEELQVLNEELRSAAEELETSREELQSINEELRTVNQELKIKIEEITQARNNLQNLVNSTNIGTIFLDRAFRVALFTPAATELFHLIAADYGRPLSDITHRLVEVNVLADAERVLSTLQPIEREVMTVDQRAFLMRVQPYRTDSDHIAGVVVSFLDITERKRAEDAVSASEAKYRTLFETMNQGFGIAEILVGEDGRPVDYRMLEINPQFERLTGQRREQFLTGQTVRKTAPELEEEWYQFYGEVGLSGNPAHREMYAAAWNRWFEVSAYRTGAAEQRRVAILYTEITERKRREANQQLLVEISANLSRLSNEEEIIRSVGAKLAAHVQLTCYHYVDVNEERAEVTIRSFWHALEVPYILGTYPIPGFIPPHGVGVLRSGESAVINDVQNDFPDDSAATAALKAGAAAQKIDAYVAVPYSQDGRWKAYFAVADSSPRQWTSLEIELIQQVANLMFPRIERARTEQALRESEARFRRVFTNNMVPMFVWTPEGETVDANNAFLDLIGYTREELEAGKCGWDGLTPPELRARDLQAVAEVVEQGFCTPYEKPFRHKDGHLVPFLVGAGVFDYNTFSGVCYAIDLTERKRAEELLRESEEKYRSLFTSIDDGFCIIERVAGEPLDFRYLEANPAFAKQSGIEDVVGKTIRQVVPGEPEEWFELYDRVLNTREPMRFERRLVTTGRVLELYAFPVAGSSHNREAVIFKDITERKRHEANLALLAEVSENLVHLVNLDETIHSLCERIGRHFGAAACAFSEVDEAAGTVVSRYVWHRADAVDPSVVFRIEDYHSEEIRQRMRTGRPEIVRDSTAFPAAAAADMAALHIGSYVNTPLVQEGQWRQTLSITDSNPRDWPADEIELMQELTTRIWTRIERARTEAALRESEAKYRSLFDSIDAGFCIFEMLYNEAGEAIDFRYIETNPAFERQSGRRPQRGQTMRELFPEVEDMWLKEYAEVARTGQPKRFIDFQADLGRWFNVFVFPTSNDTKQLAALFSDVTDEKQADAALRVSEERLQKALSIETVGVIFFDLEGGINDANAAFLHLSGYGCEQLRSGAVRWDMLTPPEFMPATLHSRAELLSLGQNTPYEKQYIRPDGSRWWGLFAGKRLTEHECVEFVIDITERKQAEGALRESEARFRTLTDAVPQVIWANDADGRATYFNQRWYSYSGLTYDESAGPGWQVIVHPDDAPASVELWNRALVSGATFDTEYRLRRADDAYRWHLGRNVPLRDESGQVIGWFGSATDIEDLKQAEAAVQRAHDELELRVQERTSELASANRALQQEIAERRRLEAQRVALMERIITAQESERQRIARELHDTLGQFLSALNLRLSLAQSLDSMPRIVREELAQLRVLTGQIDQEVDRLTMELRPPALEHLGLPDALHSYVEEWSTTSGIPVDVLVTGLDTTRLPAVIETTTYRIVQEALTNVLKHAEARSVSVIVERRVGELRVIVEDDGVGFDPSLGRTQGAGGRQVGLIGMAERAALAGGELMIESAPGTGTSIHLRIPLGDDTSGGAGDAREYDPGVTG